MVSSSRVGFRQSHIGYGDCAVVDMLDFFSVELNHEGWRRRVFQNKIIYNSHEE